jgi:hypothetical protein
MQRVGYGLWIEASGLRHRLNVRGECAVCHVAAERGDVAFTLILGW